MIEEHWPRICGVHSQDDGILGAIWIAHDLEADRLHLYDCAVFAREVLAVIADGILSRGKRIPVAWAGTEIRDELEKRGVFMTYDRAPTTPKMAEMLSLEVLERMRGKRFQVAKSARDWLQEFESFGRQDGSIPVDGYPLMAATRNAVHCLHEARTKRPPSEAKHKKVAIV